MCVSRSDLVWEGWAPTPPAGPAGSPLLCLLCWRPDQELGPPLEGWTGFPQSLPAGPAGHKPIEERSFTSTLQRAVTYSRTRHSTWLAGGWGSTLSAPGLMETGWFSLVDSPDDTPLLCPEAFSITGILSSTAALHHSVFQRSLVGAKVTSPTRKTP